MVLLNPVVFVVVLETRRRNTCCRDISCNHLQSAVSDARLPHAFPRSFWFRLVFIKKGSSQNGKKNKSTAGYFRIDTVHWEEANPKQFVEPLLDSSCKLPLRCRNIALPYSCSPGRCAEKPTLVQGILSTSRFYQGILLAPPKKETLQEHQ